jgi:NAD(P)-dependent dehydrogenase (short-subunit alcohol dehydrogenase family)
MSEKMTTFVSDFAAQQGLSTEQASATFLESVAGTSLIKRFATTEEVASLCVYLASEQAAIAGAALRVDGGVPNTVF